jgi:hypothetical protein
VVRANHAVLHLRRVGDPEQNDIVFFVEIYLASATVRDFCAMTYTEADFSPQLSRTAARSHRLRHTDFIGRAQITRAHIADARLITS